METYSSSLENVCKLTTCIEHKWKHGGSEYNYTEEAFRVKEDCEVLGVEEPYVKIKVGDKIKTYLLPDPEYREVTIEKHLKAGDILFDLKKKEHLTAPLAKASAFVGANTMMDVLKKGVEFCDCFSLAEGTIHLLGPGKVEIAGIVHHVNPDCIMYYGEGDQVPRFKRICSGVADIRNAHKVLRDYKLTFLIYRKQVMQLVPGMKNYDIIEAMYKSTYNFGFSLKKKLNTNTDLIGSLYKGQTRGNKSVLKDFVNKQDMKLYDPNDLLYKLIFADGLTEIEPS